MTFTKATKKQSKLRLAIFGPAGSGKTFTALRIASGMGKRIALIDTEHGSASKYSDLFNFDVAELNEAKIENYISVISQASEYDVLIIDSLSHGWAELLLEIDHIAKTKFKGNSWSAWSEGTPKQKRMIEAILEFPGHVIATMRSKTEWVVENTDGKNRPVKVGLAPEQGKGIEYEFDMLIEINAEHYALVTKDRTGKFQDKGIEKPGENLGEELFDWLNSGESIEDQRSKLTDQIKDAESVNDLNLLYKSNTRIINDKIKEQFTQKKLTFKPVTT